jgi:hypothetical protein
MLFALDSRSGIHISGGVGYISQSNSDWKKAVRALAASATRIVVIPDTGRNMLWELSLLKRRGWLGKTVLLLPPSSGLDKSAEKAPTDWNRLRETLRKRFIQVPEYDATGRLFTLNSDGTVNREVEYRADAGWLSEQIPELLMPKGSDTTSKRKSLTRRVAWMGSAAAIGIVAVMAQGQCQHDPSVMTGYGISDVRSGPSVTGGLDYSTRGSNQHSAGFDVKIPEIGSCERMPSMPGVAISELFIGGVRCVIEFVPFVAGVVTPVGAVNVTALDFEERLNMSDSERTAEERSKADPRLSNIDVRTIERTSQTVTFLLNSRVGFMSTLMAASEVRLKDRLFVIRMSLDPPGPDREETLRNWSLSFVHAFVQLNTGP